MRNSKDDHTGPETRAVPRSVTLNGKNCVNAYHLAVGLPTHVYQSVCSLGSRMTGSEKSELICLLRPRLVVGVTLQHANNPVTDETKEASTLLQTRNVCSNATYLHTRQIEADRGICRHD